MANLPERRFTKQGLTMDFEGQPVRCGGTFEKPWFCAKDICDALGISNAGNAIARLDTDQKGEIRLTDTIGRNQRMAVLYESGLFELILRSDKPGARAFRKWITDEVLPAIRRTGGYSARTRRYLAAGKDIPWIEKREEGVEARNQFTRTLQNHGVEGSGFGQITNAIYYPLLGNDAQGVKTKMGLPKNASIRDNLPIKEILMIGLTEVLAREKIEKENCDGNHQCKMATSQAANAVANVEKRLGKN